MKRSIDKDISGLESLIGLTLLQCYRKLLDEVLGFEIDSEEQEQEWDGLTYLVFSENRKVLFMAYTEEFSVKVFPDRIVNLEDYRDMSNNSFWRNKIGQEVTAIIPIYSEFRSNPYGVRFVLSNNEQFDLVYSSDENDPDALVIK